MHSTDTERREFDVITEHACVYYYYMQEQTVYKLSDVSLRWPLVKGSKVRRMKPPGGNVEVVRNGKRIFLHFDVPDQPEKVVTSSIFKKVMWLPEEDDEKAFNIFDDYSKEQIEKFREDIEALELRIQKYQQFMEAHPMKVLEVN